MNEEFVIQSRIDGRSSKVSEMLADFEAQNQYNTAFSPVIRFSDDCLSSKNTVSFLCKIKDLCPLVFFETIFPKDATDPALGINSILNYLNEYPKINNRFVLKIGGTDERQRKEKFGGQALGLSDISKMFSKQPLKKKPTLEISSDIDLDISKLANLFSPEKFFFRFENCSSGSQTREETKLAKLLSSSGFTQEPFEPETYI